MTAPETYLSQYPLPEGLQGCIITDCDDPNARARQKIRFNSLFGIVPEFIELGPDSPDLEAAGHLLDVLDAAKNPLSDIQTPLVILVNDAPRSNGSVKKWENGTPFCYAKAPGAAIFSTYEGHALSLASKLGLTAHANIMDIPQVAELLVSEGQLTKVQARDIANTQFRSYEFLPLAARLISGGKTLPSEQYKVETNPEINNRYWFIDNFGNAKTTVLPTDIEYREGETRRLVVGQEVICYKRLADVPKGHIGLTVGSSGYGNNRWLELALQGGSAANKLGLRVGSMVLAG